MARPYGHAPSPDTILAAIALGQSGADIARAHGVSRERIRQIVKRETGSGLPIRGRYCRTCRMNQPTSDHRRDHTRILRDRAARRFWTNVTVDGDCWVWIGSRTKAGYGSSHASFKGSGGYAHRASYLMTKGAIPEGLELDHLCRNRACVNPAHLEAVTHRENVLRSPIHPSAINAAKTHCKHGHEFTPGNTLRNPSQPTHRRCRQCANRVQREKYARRASEQLAKAA